jgi:hypothetical protein
MGEPEGWHLTSPRRKSWVRANPIRVRKDGTPRHTFVTKLTAGRARLQRLPKHGITFGTGLQIRPRNKIIVWNAKSSGLSFQYSISLPALSFRCGGRCLPQFLLSSPVGGLPIAASGFHDARGHASDQHKWVDWSPLSCSCLDRESSFRDR